MAALGSVGGGEGDPFRTAFGALDGENWSEILSAFGEGLVAFDEQSGRVLDVNEGACRMFGSTRPELLARPWILLWDTEDKQATQPADHAREARAKGASRFVHRAVRSDGSHFWTEVCFAPARARDGVVLALIRDVSLLKSKLAASGIAEDRYRALVRNLPNSAIIVCDHTLRFVLVDGPELAATGFSKEAMEGKTIYETLPPDFVTLIEAHLRRVLAGESFSAEIPFGERWYTYNYVPLFDDAGRVIYGMILALNVTERRRAEDALRRSEERFSRIFRTSPDAMCLTRSVDGKILEVNPSFEKMFRWNATELVGTSARGYGFMGDADTKELLEAFHERGALDFIERNVTLKDGCVVETELSMRSVDLDGQACILSICRDVSEQRKAHRALEASEARLRGLAEATFEGIGMSENGRIIDVNDQLAGMFGMKPSELIGQSVAVLVAPESRAEVRARMDAGREDPYEHFAIRPDGTRFPVEVRSRAAVVHGKVHRVAAVRDITARRKADVEREGLIAELRARNAEMEQFTYTVSHDLKSPLVTISGFLGMLERDMQAGDAVRVRADLARIGSAADKMMRLLGDLLELSRVGRVTHAKERVSLRDVVQEAVELVAGVVAERKVRIDVAPDLPDVYADRLRLVQVFQNLLENAVKYIGPTEAPGIHVGYKDDGANVVCFVRDNGIGVDPRFAERIFGLFEKLDPKSEGTGLGLALVRRILEFHGGRVWVESDGKRGSTFLFSLPKQATPADFTPANGAV